MKGTSRGGSEVRIHPSAFILHPSPGRARSDPGGEVGDLRGRELAARRHLDRAGVADGLDEEAGFRLPGNDRGAAGAAFAEPRRRVQAEAAFGARARMTGVAALDEERADL